MASLLLLTGTKRGLRILLQGNRIVLGRDAACDIVIDKTMLRNHSFADQKDSVSRRHAIISCFEGDYYLEDGDGKGGESRNHTFVNEQQVPFPGRVLLRDNDCIRICDFSCTFHLDIEASFAVEATFDTASSSLSLQTQPTEKLRIILEISNSLSTTLEIDTLLPQILDSLFLLFKSAERGFVILWDETSETQDVRAFKTSPGVDAADIRFSASVVRRCLENMQAILGNNVSLQFPDSDSVQVLPIRSLMCAPLWSQDGRPLGAIQLDTQRPRTKFTEEDLNLLLGVASQASIALCNARLHQEALINQRRQRALEEAQQVQRALLPQQMPDIPGYEFHAYYESAQEVGGDYFDFIPLPQQRLAILLGDVAGKGVPAALVMAKFSVEVRVCLQTEPDLAAAVSKLNALMSRVSLADRFVTLVALVLDPATHTATLVNAGHPSPLLVRHATGAVEEAAPARISGPPIGIHAVCDYAGCAVHLLPGDGLFLFSDGIIEAMNPQDCQFKSQGVHDVLALARGSDSPRQTGECLIRAVKHHASGCSQNDDITLVCLGRTLAS